MMKLPPFSRSGIQSLFAFLVFLLVILFVTIILTMFVGSVEYYLSNLTGINQGAKLTLLHTLGIGMGGVFIALQALASHRRAIAMENAANAQAKATQEQANSNMHTEQGQRQDRLKIAIEHLGHISASVRLAGIYELYRLAWETPTFREIIFDILCSHIRQTTTDQSYREKHGTRPTTEIQSILTLIFVNKHDIFTGYRADLRGSCLNKVNLSNARLVGTNLEGVQLQQANLHRSCLQDSTFLNANLSGAYVMGADLSGARIFTSQFQGAMLTGTILRGSTIIGAKMQLVDAREAQFQGCRIENLQMQGANVMRAQFQGTQRVESTEKSGEGISIGYLDNINKAVNEVRPELSELVLLLKASEKSEIIEMTKGVSIQSRQRGLDIVYLLI